MWLIACMRQIINAQNVIGELEEATWNTYAQIGGE
jgi:hypothetical protein